MTPTNEQCDVRLAAVSARSRSLLLSRSQGSRLPEGRRASMRARIAARASWNLCHDRARERREGIAAVEMAFVMPLFLILLLGLMQLTSLFDSYNLFSMAAREGGRLALFEREGMVPEGTTTNQLVEQEVKRYLEAHGFESEHIDINICFPGEPNRPFDLDDDDNSLQLFEVRVGYKLDELLYTPPPGAEEQQLLSSMVFRNSPGRIIQ